MKRNNDITDDLLVKCLIGEATEAEQTAVNRWVQENDENKRYYDNLKLIWHSSKKLEAKSAVDTDAAWQNFRQRISDEKENSRIIPINRLYTHWLRAAVILILVSVGGWLIYNMNYSTEWIALQSADEVITKALADGSIVTLNKQSVLKYPENFNGETREIRLDGEAFFEVAADKNRPFIIKSNGVEVKVTGTSFNVKSSADTTEVIVATGSVEVSKKEHEVRLSPNEKVVVAKGATMIKEAFYDELYSYYKTKEFVCKSTPLWRLVEALNIAYDTDIVIANDSIRNLKLTTTFSDESLNNIISVISNTLNIRAEQNGQQIILK